MRLFVCVWPDDTVRRRLHALDVDRVVGGGPWRAVPPENWHVTLRFLGEADPVEVDRLLGGAELDAARGSMLRFGPMSTLLGGHLVLPVAGAEGLAAAVVRATGDVGVPPRQRFEGHLTLARRRGRTPHGRGRERSAELGSVDAEQRVTEIALVASHLLADGVRYETLERYAV